MKQTVQTAEQTASMKKAIDDVIRSGRAYYKAGAGDEDALTLYHARLRILKEMDRSIHHIMDNATLFYLNRPWKVLTYKEIYHIIDLLCGTHFEEMDSKEGTI